MKNRSVGMGAFFLSGICAISSGVIVSLLQEKYGFSFSTTGMLLSFMSAGNICAAFLSGVLPNRIGIRGTVLTLSAGYFLGYLLTAVTGWPGALIASFLMIGLAKGCALNRCTVLVGTDSKDRTRGMQLMHAFYATGALLCPLIISVLAGIDVNLPMIGIAVCGLGMWFVFFFAPYQQSGRTASGSKPAGSRDFLRSSAFWLLTAMVFCQNAAETSVTGWLVTYYKQQQILTGSLSGYTMTIMWGATLIARLLIAFVIPIRNNFKALFFMGISCTVLYAVLVRMNAMIPAVLALFAFSFAMAGVNPMSTASLGKDISQESLAVLLPVGAIGGMIMPLLVGLIADRAGIQAGMAVNLIPCAGIILISAVLWKKSAVSGVKS